MSKRFYEGLVNQGTNPAVDSQGQTTVTSLVQYYNTMTQVDTNNQWITSECAEIAFLNIGDGNFPTPAGKTAVILGFSIAPGFGISFDGNELEIDMTKYQVKFIGAGVQNLSVFRKMFR